MRYITIIFLVLCWGQCLSQADYDEILSLRLDEIKKLAYYDNGVVIHVDSVEYHDLSFPYWNPHDTYYQDDMARYKHCQYRVLADSTTGHRPDTSRTDWALSRRPHPYLFLRDTARLDDLKRLMLDQHSY